MTCELKGEEIITLWIDLKKGKHFVNDGEENKYFANYSGGNH